MSINEVISKLLEQPTKKHGDKQHRKNLSDREEKHLTDNTGIGSIAMRSKATSQHSGNTENVICHLMRSDSEVSE